MIEVPRAALRADEIAEVGRVLLVRHERPDADDARRSRATTRRASSCTDYLEEGVLERNPFEVLDMDGVGELMRIAVERGRATKPEIKLGICGEHGGEPRSIAFCHELGLDYVRARRSACRSRGSPPRRRRSLARARRSTHPPAASPTRREPGRTSAALPLEVATRAAEAAAWTTGMAVRDLRVGRRAEHGDHDERRDSQPAPRQLGERPGAEKRDRGQGRDVEADHLQRRVRLRAHPHRPLVGGVDAVDPEPATCEGERDEPVAAGGGEEPRARRASRA